MLGDILLFLRFSAHMVYGHPSDILDVGLEIVVAVLFGKVNTTLIFNFCKNNIIVTVARVLLGN